CLFFFFFQAEDGIRDKLVTGVQTCALPIYGCSCRGSVRGATASRRRRRSGSWPARSSPPTARTRSRPSLSEPTSRTSSARASGQIGRASCREREERAAGGGGGKTKVGGTTW